MTYFVMIRKITKIRSMGILPTMRKSYSPTLMCVTHQLSLSNSRLGYGEISHTHKNWSIFCSFVFLNVSFFKGLLYLQTCSWTRFSLNMWHQNKNSGTVKSVVLAGILHYVYLYVYVSKVSLLDDMKHDYKSVRLYTIR